MPLLDLSDKIILRILSFVVHQNVKSATQIKVLKTPATQILFADLKRFIFTDDFLPGFSNLHIVAEDRDLAELVGTLRLQPRLTLRQDVSIISQHQPVHVSLFIFQLAIQL
jgi:hypothetical protein